MSRMMIQAATTMNQLQNKLDLIGHNLANSQTTGYKSRHAEFTSLLHQQINNLNDPANMAGRLTPDGIRVGSGSKLGPTQVNLSVGSMIQTNRKLDTALLGENHLFQIQVEQDGVNQTQYTRDGAFYLSPVNNGESVMLTTKDGHPVMGVNGPIVMREGFEDIDILSDGQITVKRNNETEFVGQISVVEAVRPQLLEAVGNNNFIVPDLAALGYNVNDVIQAVNLYEDTLKSATLEASNVDLAQQMTDMLMTQRSYQFNARTISMGDQMLGLVNQLR